MSRSKTRSPAARVAPPVAGEAFFADQAKEDLAWWREQRPKIAARIDQLIADIRLHPFAGIGKPEPLKHALSGYWSRRIDRANRLVYRAEAGRLYILQARYHH